MYIIAKSFAHHKLHVIILGGGAAQWCGDLSVCFAIGRLGSVPLSSHAKDIKNSIYSFAAWSSARVHLSCPSVEHLT